MKYLITILLTYASIATAEIIVVTDDDKGGTRICNVYCSPDGKNCRVVCI